MPIPIINLLLHLSICHIFVYLFITCLSTYSLSVSHIYLAFYYLSIYLYHMWCVLPRWCIGKEFTCQCRRHRRLRFDPWVGKIPQRRKWQPTPVLLPEKLYEQKSLAGSWGPWAYLCIYLYHIYILPIYLSLIYLPIICLYHIYL